jgi:peptide/nickel transport system permease protein
MSILTTTTEVVPAPKAVARRRSSAWLNGKLVGGAALLAMVVLLGLIGPLVWNPNLARLASSPLNLPPFWVHGGQLAHPLGTENEGRDMLSLIIVGAPLALRIGFIVGLVSIGIGCVLGFTAGYVGGWADYIIRALSDTALTIPSLAILIVISSYIHSMDVTTMALIVALFAWAGPTRLLRSQVLSMREQGYVRMARLSALSSFDIMFKEIMPNLLPYLAASFVGSASGGILAAVGLEALGLGPQQVPTLGMTIYYALQSSAIIRGMWWWWGAPTGVLVVLFTSFFLITIGLDEIANPRLRGARA